VTEPGGAVTGPGGAVTGPGGLAAAGAAAGAAMSYAAAGVDIEAGDRAVELMKGSVQRTYRAGVRGDLGGFAGLFQLDLSRYPDPVLATSTDGVGTKLVIAQQMDRHDTIGIDLVAMVIDDLVVVGAEPLFMTDYIATGKVVPDKIAAIVAGIAEGCVRAGCALVGGETAEHPGVMGEQDYDISGAGTGVVNADAVLRPESIRPGDVLIAMASSGLHSNGYSLVRHIVAAAGLSLDERPATLAGRTLGEELLTPTRIYAQDCLQLIRTLRPGTGLRALSHITGGGLAGNLARVLPDGVDAVVDRASWSPPAVFQLLATAGAVARSELEPAFNLGVGMVAVVAPGAAGDALRLLADREVPSWVLGTVQDGTGTVLMTGQYADCSF
jgi:phosphoribosylformylglycinamidine cyclo-ligase